MDTLEKLRELEHNFVEELEKLKMEALAQNEEIWYRFSTETRRRFLKPKEDEEEEELVYDSTRSI